MSPAPSVHVRDVFNDALEQPPEERDAYLAAACVDDQSMWREVHSLLLAHDFAARELEPGSTPLDAAGVCGRLVGSRIGAYHIQRLIAAGGMGAVYEATQEQPRRIVALKLLRHGIASRSALRRFEYETQILARLRHPGIAQIYEANTHDDGRGAMPFFAMEYIPAAYSLTAFAVHHALSTRQRLELFVSVCDAVHHGHQRGIIHRDLKPSNILVDSSGAAKIIDFGVARATDADLAVTCQTDVGQLIGTLQYMSPEQCAADPHDLDTRTDVYSLGVVLYELLCDKPPYDLSCVALPEAMRVIREQPPRRLSDPDRSLRGDVETIVLKALEKDRTRRYQSAGDLGEDIRRYLRHDPIQARPPSVVYQLRTFARRNRAVVSSLTVLFLMLVATTVVVTILLIQTEQERQAKNKIAQDVMDLFGDQVMGAVMIADRERDHAMAREWIEEAGRRLQQRFGDQPEVMARNLLTLGAAHEWIGDFKEAEDCFMRAVELEERLFGPTHERTLDARGRLAGVYRNLADHRRAENEFLAIIQQHRAQDTPNAGVWQPLADMYLDLGRCSDAEHLLNEAIDFLKAPERGPLSPTYLQTDLANVYRNQGRYAEADRVFTEILERCRLGSLEQPAAAARPTRELARLRMVEGRFDDARESQERALNLFLESGHSQPDGLDVLLCVELGGLIDLRTGRIEEALETFIDAAERADRSFNSENVWWAAHFRVDQAICLIHKKEFAQAESLLRSSCLVLSARLGDGHHRTQNCMRLLAQLLATTDREDESRQWLARCRSQQCR